MEKSVASFAWSGLALLLACGRGEPEPSSIDSVQTSGGEQSLDTSEPASDAVTNPELAAALRFACDVTTDGMADRSKPVRARADQIELRIRESEHYPTLDAFFESEEASPGQDEDRPPPSRWERTVLSAERQGVPGFECPAMERMLAMLTSGEDDVDRGPPASFADDLERMCQVVSEPLPEDVAPASRMVQYAVRIDDAITNPTLRQVWSAIASVDASSKYALMQAAAREEGFPDWTCPALERLLSGR
jgi:hypothetical protein